MSKNNTYEIIEVEGEGNYLLGPTEFANESQFPYKELRLWKFRNDNYCLSLLQKKKKILIAYADSPELDKLLVDRGVRLEEHLVVDVQKDGWKIKIQGGYLLELEHRWTYAYCLHKDYRDEFFSFFDGCDRNTEGPNLAPNLVVDKKVTHLISVEGTEDGNLPKELHKYLSKAQIETKKETGSSLSVLAFIIILACLIGLFYFGWNS